MLVTGMIKMIHAGICALTVGILQDADILLTGVKMMNGLVKLAA